MYVLKIHWRNKMVNKYQLQNDMNELKERLTPLAKTPHGKPMKEEVLSTVILVTMAIKQIEEEKQARGEVAVGATTTEIKQRIFDNLEVLVEASLIHKKRLQPLYSRNLSPEKQKKLKEFNKRQQSGNTNDLIELAREVEVGLDADIRNIKSNNVGTKKYQEDQSVKFFSYDEETGLYSTLGPDVTPISANKLQEAMQISDNEVDYLTKRFEFVMNMRTLQNHDIKISLF